MTDFYQKMPLTHKISLDVYKLLKLTDNLLGIPWVERGRDTSGFDCYGLVIYCYKHFLDIDLPEFEYIVADIESKLTTVRNAQFAHSFKQVARPQPMDIVLLNYFGSPTHVALYLGESYILHVSNREATYRSRLTDMDGLRTIESRIEGYYRWQYV